MHQRWAAPELRHQLQHHYCQIIMRYRNTNLKNGFIPGGRL